MTHLESLDTHMLVFPSPKIITIDEAKRRQSFGSCDGDLSVDALPMLSDTSDLLQDTHIEKVLAAGCLTTLPTYREENDNEITMII